MLVVGVRRSGQTWDDSTPPANRSYTTSRCNGDNFFPLDLVQRISVLQVFSSRVYCFARLICTYLSIPAPCPKSKLPPKPISPRKMSPFPNHRATHSKNWISMSPMPPSAPNYAPGPSCSPSTYVHHPSNPRISSNSLPPALPLRHRPRPNHRRHRHPRHHLRPRLRSRLLLDWRRLPARQRRRGAHLGQSLRHLRPQTRPARRRGFVRCRQYAGRDEREYEHADCCACFARYCGRGDSSAC